MINATWASLNENIETHEDLDGVIARVQAQVDEGRGLILQLQRQDEQGASLAIGVGYPQTCVEYVAGGVVFSGYEPTVAPDRQVRIYNLHNTVLDVRHPYQARVRFATARQLAHDFMDDGARSLDLNWTDGDKLPVFVVTYSGRSELLLDTMEIYQFLARVQDTNVFYFGEYGYQPSLRITIDRLSALAEIVRNGFQYAANRGAPDFETVEATESGETRAVSAATFRATVEDAAEIMRQLMTREPLRASWEMLPEV